MKAKSRHWMPLAYPRAALIDVNKEENLLFPLHRTMLTVVLRELLVLDGTLDPETLTFTEELAWHKHIKTQKMKRMTHMQGHLTPGWRAHVVSTSDNKEGKGSRRRGRNPQEEAVVPRKRPCLGRRDNLHEPNFEISEEKAGLDENPVNIECSSGEELAAVLLGRCIRGQGQPTVDARQQQCSTTKQSMTKHTASSGDELPQSPRARKVSDLDMMDDNHQADKNHLGDTPMATANDICRFSALFAQEITTNLDEIRFHLTRYDLPPLLEAGIVTEARLRSLAASLCHDLFSSFSDHSLRTFLGYKSPSISRRQFLVPMLADYLFVTSHALFAWEATQREMIVTGGRTLEQRNSNIRETLFDHRTLESLGGWEWSSLFRQAVHWLTWAEKATTSTSSNSWECWARTKQGHRALAHLKSTEATLRVARRRRQGKRPARQVNKVTKDACLPSVDEEGAEENLSQTTRSPSPTIASQPAALQPRVEAKVNCLPSTSTVRLQRTPGQSWGVLLSREGDMCVVARGSTDPSRDLRSGDIILRAENELGTTVHLSYREIVDLFKTSDQLILQVQRVSC